MALFVISDLHLSIKKETDKSMEVFGGRWENYVERLKSNWTHLVSPSDTVVIPGDISWGLTADEALDDLSFVDNLPGNKILIKGNHDLWWATMKKNRDFCEKYNLRTLDFIYNSATETDDFIIAGTRGWFADEETMAKSTDTDFEKIRLREIGRLKASLDSAEALKEKSPNKEILVFIHFPVILNSVFDTDIPKMLEAYDIKRVYYGHVHGNYQIPPCISHNGIDYYLTSADYLNFMPKYVNI